MEYWKNDLQTSAEMVNNVPTSTADPAFWQHMVTFSLSIGVKGTLDPTTDLPALKAGTKSWPNPSTDASKIDDLWHAAVNSRGTFVAAKNPKDFADGLRSALFTIGERVASASSVSGNSTLVSGDSLVTRASSSAGNGPATWWPTASRRMARCRRARPGKPPSRFLLPRRARSTHGRMAVAPRSVAGPSKGSSVRRICSTMFAASSPRKCPTAAPSGIAHRYWVTSELLADCRRQADKSWLRALLLGWSVELPELSRSQGDAHADGLCGANDGMLHGFDAKTGVEKFAFIPPSCCPVSRTWRVRNMPTASTWMASCRWPTSISVVPGRAFSSARQGVGHLDVRDRRYRPVVAGRRQHHGSSAMRRWATCFQSRPCCV